MHSPSSRRSRLSGTKLLSKCRVLGVVRISYADGKIEDIDPLTVERMETVSDEFTGAAIKWMDG